MATSSEIKIHIIIISSQLYATFSFKSTPSAVQCKNLQPLQSNEWNSTRAMFHLTLHPTRSIILFLYFCQFINSKSGILEVKIWTRSEEVGTEAASSIARPARIPSCARHSVLRMDNCDCMTLSLFDRLSSDCYWIQVIIIECCVAWFNILYHVLRGPSFYCWPNRISISIVLTVICKALIN